MAYGVRQLSPVRRAFILIGLALGLGVTSRAGPPEPASVEDRLRRQDELIRKLAEQNSALGEQNRRLGEQLQTISRRLDAMSPPAVVPAPPVVDGGAAAEESTSKPAPPVPDASIPEAKPAPSPEAAGPSHSSAATAKGLVDSLHRDDDYGLKSLFDSLHPHGAKGTPWYEKLSLRGYTQVRYGRTLYDRGAMPSLMGDGSINGVAEGFSIRRARLILSGDVSDHLALYFQTDFANTPPGSTTSTFFAQVRDLYADVYIDTTKVNRFRIGQSKLPYAFEDMQSSGNRVPIDRTDAMDSAVFPNQRDLGLFYYWTPVKKQELLRELAEGGLKGSGNYGIFGLGIYNGQGGGLLEKNRSPYAISRLTWPFRLANGQVVEASVAAYTGTFVPQGAPIRPLGLGAPIVPAGTESNRGLRDQRIAGSFIYYPQPFGLQAEWNVGRGPGLNDAQTAIEDRSVNGGYVMAMYKLDTPRAGIFIPYARYQYFLGGYRAFADAPYGKHNQWNLGVEWQIRKEMELVTEYSFVDGINLNAVNQPSFTSFGNFNAGVLRAQFQFNY